MPCQYHKIATGYASTNKRIEAEGCACVRVTRCHFWDHTQGLLQNLKKGVQRKKKHGFRMCPYEARPSARLGTMKMVVTWSPKAPCPEFINTWLFSFAWGTRMKLTRRWLSMTWWIAPTQVKVLLLLSVASYSRAAPQKPDGNVYSTPQGGLSGRCCPQCQNGAQHWVFYNHGDADVRVLVTEAVLGNHPVVLCRQEKQGLLLQFETALWEVLQSIIANEPTRMTCGSK